MELEREPATRKLTVLAQDPDVNLNGKALTTQVTISNEPLLPGPRGSRVEVVDYDASSDQFYGAHDLGSKDIYECESNHDLDMLVSDPRFHAQNVYGIVASTLFDFERALGRYLTWGFKNRSHQLKVFPNAFLEANAFYSKQDECLAFGYFPIRGPNSERIYTCLSHDIVTHETTHALIDSLRSQLMRPSSADQAAFHEGFSDIVALLKILQSEELVRFALDDEFSRNTSGIVSLSDIYMAIENPEGSFLWGLASQMGRAVNPMGRGALRQSISLTPSPDHYHGTDFKESHNRGEILVAAVLRAYLKVWKKRLAGKLKKEGGKGRVDRVATWRVAEEGSKAAKHLLNLFIRALDYLPPVHVDFGDFLSAALTADWQMVPDDKPYGYRDALCEAFAAYGIKPASSSKYSEYGVWGDGMDGKSIMYTSGNMDAMRWNPEGIFNLLWKNLDALGLEKQVYTRVNSVHPVWRTGPDGFVLRETVAEYYQLIKKATPPEFRQLNIPVPDFVDDHNPVDLVGGGTLIFDEFGRLKFHIHNRIGSARAQEERLISLWQRGGLLKPDRKFRRFAALHGQRASFESSYREEGWS